MPAARTTKPASAKKAAAPAKPTSRKAAKSTTVNGHGDTTELIAKANTLLASKAYSSIIELLAPATLAGSAALETIYAKAYFHLETSPTEPQTEQAAAASSALLATSPTDAAALLCAGKVQANKGDWKGAADKALEAFKASEYKDQDAMKFLQECQVKAYSPDASTSNGDTHAKSAEAVPDHYAILHVTKDAPAPVIQAAYSALTFEPESAEGIAAKAAFDALSDPTTREAYDATLPKANPNSRSGGGGKEFSGGSELMKLLGEALGLSFPVGFVWPENGRFQGGFGGGFEYTWGDKPDEAAKVEEK